MTRSSNICFDCKKAYGGCSWTELDKNGRVRFEPVPGWTAKEITIRFDKRKEKTWHITKCPLFEPDNIRVLKGVHKYE